MVWDNSGTGDRIASIWRTAGGNTLWGYTDGLPDVSYSSLGVSDAAPSYMFSGLVYNPSAGTMDWYASNTSTLGSSVKSVTGRDSQSLNEIQLGVYFGILGSLKFSVVEVIAVNGIISAGDISNLENYIQTTYFPSYDPDAQAFFDAITTAGGSLTSTEEDAVNTLVLDLKSYGLWTKMIGLWPVVGTTSTTQSFNLKDPTEYNLGFNGTWSHTSAGASPGAGYATTGIIPSVIDFATLGSVHYSLYITEDYPGGCYDMGAYTPSGGDFGMLSSCGNNTAYIGTGTGWLTVGNGGSTKQNWLMTNDGSTSYIYSNGSEIASGARTITTGPDVQIYISANNNNGGVFIDYSERAWALASIGLGMDATEAADYDTAVVAFQTTLGRQN